MTYRFTFYKIPFSETGVEYPLPTVGNPTESFARYKTAELLTTAAFRENQSNIVFSKPDTIITKGILKSNYMRVGVVVAPGTIDTDENVAFYWVRDVECLGGVSVPPLNVTIAPDDIMTEFFSAPASAGAKISGRLSQCSLNLQNADNNFYPRSISAGRPFYWNYSDSGFNFTYSYKNDQPKNDFSLLVSTTDQYGRMRFFVKRGLKYNTAAQEIENLSRTNKITYQTPSVPNYTANCEVTNIFVLPSSFIPSDVLTNDYQCDAFYLNEKGESKNTRVLLFTESETVSFFWSVLLTFPTKNIFTPESVIYLRTPINLYKIVGDKSNAVPITGISGEMSIQFSIPQRGTNTDDFEMLLVGASEEPINITEDFKISFAINEAAQNRAQFGTLYALKQVSAVVGGLGGAIGGAVSGNYFGAVQSIFGGVEAIADSAAAVGGPAQIKSSENAINRIFSLYDIRSPATQNCVSILFLEPNYGAQKATRDYYGYIYDGDPQIEFTTSELQEAFYRFKACSAVNLDGGGQGAQATVEALFTRGVRFKAL